MINNRGTLFEVNIMSRTKHTPDFWEEIIDSLVLEIEPPTRYIKDATIVTKTGAKIKLSPAAFAHLLAKEKMIPPDQSEIRHCSLSIDFTRIKKDMGKWANELIGNIENSFETSPTKSRKKSSIKKLVAKMVKTKAKAKAKR